MRDEEPPPLTRLITYVAAGLTVLGAGTMMSSQVATGWLPGWSATTALLVAIALVLLIISDHVWLIAIHLRYLRRDLRERRED
jgi:hypothetical protein